MKKLLVILLFSFIFLQDMYGMQRVALSPVIRHASHMQMQMRRPAQNNAQAKSTADEVSGWVGAGLTVFWGFVGANALYEYKKKKDEEDKRKDELLVALAVKNFLLEEEAKKRNAYGLW